MRRRAFLTTLAATGPGLGSGCLSSLDDSALRLGYLDVANWDTEPHRLEVRVARDGAQVHTSSHELSGRDTDRIPSEVVDCTWDDMPGEYTVSGRADDGARTEQPLRPSAVPDADADCLAVGVWYRSGSVGFQIASGCDSDYDGMCPFTSE